MTVCDIEPTMTVRENDEEACIQDFVVKGCGCDIGPSRSQCSRLFPIEHYRSIRSTFAELSHDELDLVVMGQVMAHTFQSTSVVGHHNSSPTERKITYTHFYHQGHRVCSSSSSIPSGRRGFTTSSPASSKAAQFREYTGTQARDRSTSFRFRKLRTSSSMSLTTQVRIT